MRNRLILCILSILVFKATSAQSNDPALATAIAIGTKDGVSQVTAQNAAIIAETGVHLWTKEESEGIANLQTTFNNYLNSFNNIIAYAAQLYGFYHEVTVLRTNLPQLLSEAASHPTNALAVSILSEKRQYLTDLTMECIGVLNDIRMVMVQPIKKTEKELAELVFGIRAKLKVINQKIYALRIRIHYTTLADIWNEIMDLSNEYAGHKVAAILRAKRKWTRQIGKVTPESGGRWRIGTLM